MSFGTKMSMWWGTVKGNTEQFFGKETKRLVAHEYYDNPNPPSARPKSMHTIASQSKRAAMSSRGPQDKQDKQGQGFNKKNSSSNLGSKKNSGVAPREKEFVDDYQMDQGYPGAGPGPEGQMMGDQMQVENYDQQGMYPQDHGMMQGGGDGTYPQDPNYYPQNPGVFPSYPSGQDPNMYPQDPNGYPQDASGYPQDPNAYNNGMMMQQDPNMFPQNQGMYPQNGYPQQQQQQYP